LRAQNAAMHKQVRDGWLALYATFSPDQKAIVRDSIRARSNGCDVPAPAVAACSPLRPGTQREGAARKGRAFFTGVGVPAMQAS
jgi:hypothetical protein